MIRLGQTISVNDSSAVATARRTARQCADELRFDETRAGKSALVATELATNILKHGDGGMILFGADHDDPATLVMVALDRGRGIANVTAAMEDGYSTAGSPGTGMGAISRNATQVDVYTQPGRGTAVLCRIEGSEPKRRLITPRFTFGGVCVAKPGEDHVGDSWVAIEGREAMTIAVADGLGHGMFASTASTAAVRVIAERADWTLERILQEAHGALRSTRGAAVGIARIAYGQNKADFSGIGNIAGTIASDDATRRTVSLNGIVGHEMRRVQTFSYPWNNVSALILASDGISTSWNLSNYPGLLQRDPALIAAVLFRDHTRGTDDATVVVAKNV